MVKRKIAAKVIYYDNSRSNIHYNANCISPITLIGLASSLKQTEIAFLLKNAMFIAGIVTLIQLYPIWKIGSRLPIVMSVSFNFVAILTYVGATYGYASAMGAVLIGGLIEGCLGLLARY